MGAKVPNNISSERTHQICSPKFIDTPAEGLYYKVVKRIRKFDILNFWHFFFPFNMVVNLEL